MSGNYGAFIEAHVPGASTALGRARWKLIALALVMSLVSAIATSYFAFGFNLLTLNRVTEAQKRAELDADRLKSPFVASVFPENIRPEDVEGPVIVVFEKALGTNEQNRLTAYDFNKDSLMEFWRILQSFSTPPTVILPTVPIGGHKGSHAGVTLERTLSLQSDRQGSVVINDIRATDIKCAPSAAEAIVYIAPEGGEVAPDLVLDLADRVINPGLMSLKDSESDVGTLGPYFAPGPNYIELGNGQTSWVARISEIVGNNTCEWNFAANYSYRGKISTTTISDGGRKFRTVAPPLHPRQIFELRSQTETVVKWICAGSWLAPGLPCAAQSKQVSW